MQMKTQPHQNQCFCLHLYVQGHQMLLCIKLKERKNAVTFLNVFSLDGLYYNVIYASN